MQQQKPSKPITEYFATINEPRHRRNRHHLLTDIIVIGICATTADCEGWEEIEEYARHKERWLSGFLELPYGIPSHDTFRRVFIQLDPQQLLSAFLEWIEASRETLGATLIAIDGKTVRRSHDSRRRKSALHLVSAWAVEHSLVLGQVATKEKSNEIVAIPKLLDLLDLNGSIVTIDAMGCQSAIAAKIVEKKGEYVLAVKDNQKNLHEQLKWFFSDIELPADLSSGLVARYESFDKDHGRLERRDYLVSGELDWMKKELQGFPQVKSIGMVRCTRTVGAKRSTETRYYISSLAPDPLVFARSVRGHWAIENSLHWVLDVTFREDESRKRLGYSPHNMAVLRRIALMLVKRDTASKKSLRLRRKQANWDDGYLQSLLLLPDPPSGALKG
jgi:predicted transposase YbfD/YdcC